MPWQALASANHNFLLTERRRNYLRYAGGLSFFEINGPAGEWEGWHGRALGRIGVGCGAHTPALPDHLLFEANGPADEWACGTRGVCLKGEAATRQCCTCWRMITQQPLPSHCPPVPCMPPLPPLPPQCIAPTWQLPSA